MAAVLERGGEKMTLKSKRTSYGYIEIREASTAGCYALYINGELKEQSASLSYIESQYSKY